MLVKNRILRPNPPVVAGGITLVATATAQHAGNGVTINANWPAASYRRGDFVLSLYYNSTTSTTLDSDVGLGPDWIKHLYYSPGSRSHIQVWYKWIDTPFTITASDTKPLITWSGGAGGGNNSVVGLNQIWRGVDFTKPFDVDTTTANNSGTAANSPSITPVSANCLIISAFGVNVSDATPTAPSGYSNTTNSNHADTNPGSAGMASKLLATAAAEDPAAWTVTVGPWAAATMALRPAKY